MPDISKQSTHLDKKIQTITKRPIFQFALFSSTSMTVLGSVVISPSLPAMLHHFSDVAYASLLVPLILTLPALFIVIFSPIAGILVDKYGRLKFLLPAMLIWSMAGGIGFWLNDIYQILISRAVFGIATAFIMTSASTLVGDYYQGNQRQKALGKQGFATACGSAIFISLGGLLASIDWRYPFLVYLLGLGNFIFALLFLFEPKWLKKTKQAMPLESISIWHILPILLIAFFTMVAYYISPTQIPFFITNYLHKNPQIIGISMSASAIAYGFSSLLYPRIRNVFSIRWIYAISFLSIGICFVLLYVFHSYWIVMVSLIFLGAGGGAIQVNNSSYLLHITKESNRGKALGFLAAFVFLGQFASPLITQPIVDGFGLLGLFLTFGVFACLLSFLFVLKDVLAKISL